MKTTRFLFLASLLFIPQSSQESPELKEATTLTESVVTLFNERPPYLSEASVNAARLARFTPTKISGMPIKIAGVIQYHYVNRPW
jgi:hypothetical protein